MVPHPLAGGAPGPLLQPARADVGTGATAATAARAGALVVRSVLLTTYCLPRTSHYLPLTTSLAGAQVSEAFPGDPNPNPNPNQELKYLMRSMGAHVVVEPAASLQDVERAVSILNSTHHGHTY